MYKGNAQKYRDVLLFPTLQDVKRECLEVQGCTSIPISTGCISVTILRVFVILKIAHITGVSVRARLFF